MSRAAFGQVYRAAASSSWRGAQWSSDGDQDLPVPADGTETPITYDAAGTAPPVYDTDGIKNAAPITVFGDTIATGDGGEVPVGMAGWWSFSGMWRFAATDSDPSPNPQARIILAVNADILKTGYANLAVSGMEIDITIATPKVQLAEGDLFGTIATLITANGTVDGSLHKRFFEATYHGPV